MKFDAINAQLLPQLPALLRQWLPSGRVEAGEWVALNPTRHDKKAGSFRINITTGRWADFATDDKGGDPVSLYAYIRGMSQGDAARDLAGQAGVTLEAPARRSVPAPVPVLQLAPADAPPPPRHPKHGPASRTWAYRSASGDLFGYVCRFDLPDGGKEVMPLTWDGAWRWKALPKPRPLYGLDRLAAKPQATVLVVEGEKAADAAHALFPQLVAVTWAGGSKAVAHSDWAPLTGRKVIVWPDADEPGDAAMRAVVAAIRGKAEGIRWCPPPPDVAQGWDVADADPAQDWVGYMRANLREPNDAPAAAAPPAVPANDNAAGGLFDLLPDANDKGRPLSTIENLAEILRRLRVTVRYNVISKEEEILIPGEAFSVDNRANASFAWVTSWCSRLRMPTDKLGEFVTYLADRNLYNPVAEWIMSRPWDGVSRLADLYATIDAADNQLKETLIRRWLISAVAAAFNPDGVSAHGVLTLQGDQYLGKTKWFKSLVPESLGVLKDGMLLAPHDKDSVKQVCSFWLVELGELDATFRKSDIAALKSFITNKSDVLRRAYARKESHFARRTVFFASVNPKNFLHDATGNRRYWTIEAKWIDHSHSIDMQQLWAEVLALYRGGEGHYLLPDEMARLNDHNEEFTVSDPVQERLATRLEWESDPVYWTWRSATDVLIECGMDRPSAADVNKAAAFIRLKNGDQARRTNAARLLLAPRLISEGAF